MHNAWSGSNNRTGRPAILYVCGSARQPVSVRLSVCVSVRAGMCCAYPSGGPSVRLSELNIRACTCQHVGRRCMMYTFRPHPGGLIMTGKKKKRFEKLDSADREEVGWRTRKSMCVSRLSLCVRRHGIFTSLHLVNRESSKRCADVILQSRICRSMHNSRRDHF